MNSETGFKVLPQSIEAEQSVLGALMINPEAIEKVLERLTTNDFYKPAHREIFDAIKTSYDALNTLDVITIADYLSAGNILDKIGGLDYLGALSMSVPAASNLPVYVKLVKDRARLRKLIKIGNAIADSGFESDDADEAEAKSMEMVLSSTPEGQRITEINDILNEAITALDKRFRNKGDMLGQSTGFAELDKRTLGLQPTDLIVLAGRPAMGKTTLAINIIEQVAIRDGNPAMLFSLEMSSTQIVDKMISSIGGIPFGNIRSGKLNEDEWPKLSAAVSKIKDSPLYIDDRPALSISQVRMAARAKHKIKPLSLVVVDYLQLMRGDGNSQEERISSMSVGLKALAKELKCPVIAISQLNRGVESRPDKRPMCSDLRGSGAIEQDADLIWFCYRDEVYDENSPDKGICEVITGKYRHGEIGTDRLSSQLHMSRFKDLSRPYQAPAPNPKFEY